MNKESVQSVHANADLEIRNKVIGQSEAGNAGPLMEISDKGAEVPGFYRFPFYS